MVLTDITPSGEEKPVLSPEDLQIADALAAWLAALKVADSNQTFHQATNQCVSLCKLFSLFAPHLLTDRDYFTPSNVSGANVSRQRRYNTRRLSRSLASWFQIAPRLGSQMNVQSAPAVRLAPAPKETILALSDAARSEDVESPALFLSLAEVLLCAAVHSAERETFIRAVLSLSTEQQDALAQSIRRTTIEEKRPSVLGAIINNENIPAQGDVSTSIKHESSSDTGVGPPGIPLSDYKALAAERDNLRRKLAAAELEKGKATEVADELKTSLEEAADKIRALQTAREHHEEELVAKANALNDAKNALRDAHVNAEEIDVLRTKAASAEQLEASLKRASKRLEEVAEIRKSTKDLEAQISAFRENEERMGRHVEYLESQLASSTERAQKFASLSDSLSSDLEKRSSEFVRLKKENEELNTKLNTTNQQLTSMLLQSATASRSMDTSEIKCAHSGNSPDRSESDGCSESDSASLRPQVADSMGATQVMKHSVSVAQRIKPEDVKEMVSDTLFDEIGVRMTWDDIVECVRGVMDALREMDEMEEGHCVTGYEEPMHTISQTISKSTIDGIRTLRMSTQSLRSEADSHIPDVGSDAESKMSLLPEFGELDSSLAAAHGDKGDEFDYAANHTNVKEIPLDDHQVRRRPSQLPTILENREGFDATERHTYDQESSYGSGFMSDGDLEPADETVNATVPGPISGEQDEQMDCNSTERKRSEIECKKMSPGQPDSPFIPADIVIPEAQRADSELDNVKGAKSRPLSKDMRRKSSLAVSVRSGMSRSPAHSETTRSLVRQARNELNALQNALELMRAERQSSASLNALIMQLETARQELSLCQTKLRESKEELENTRMELNSLLREMDSLTAQRGIDDEREQRVLQEKDRTAGQLKASLRLKEEELSASKAEFLRGREELHQTRSSEKMLEEKLKAAKVIERAHELEIARLTAKIEANDILTTRLNAVVKRTDGLQNQMSRERERHLNDIADAARREKELAEEARDEARRVARTHASVLEDVRASAAAVAKRSLRHEDSRVHPRRGNRFSDFWRRLLHRGRVGIDYSMPASTASLPVVGEGAPRKPSTARTE